MDLVQPIKWHGGKGAFNGKLAKWIISLMPPHLHYVEPYFGGGSVLLNKDPEGVSEVVNDIHNELIVFWSVLRSEEWFSEFKRCIEAVPFSESMFEAAGPKNSTYEQMVRSAVDTAASFFVRARQSRQGLMKDFATLSRTRTRSGMNEQVSAWLNAVEGLPDVHARMKRVVILNRPALDVIRQQDGPDTCFYLDPPYLHETRATKGDYAHEMSVEDHEKLLKQLDEVKGKFLLSGDRSDLYDYWAKSRFFNRHEFKIVNNASSKETKEQKTECVWTNF
jgi:DNA adenine methylase